MAENERISCHGENNDDEEARGSGREVKERPRRWASPHTSPCDEIYGEREIETERERLQERESDQNKKKRKREEEKKEGVQPSSLWKFPWREREREWCTAPENSVTRERERKCSSRNEDFPSRERDSRIAGEREIDHVIEKIFGGS